MNEDTPSPNLLQREAKMMKLETLIAEREGISTKPFPIPVKELLHRYEQLYTGAISGASSGSESVSESESPSASSPRSLEIA